MMTPTASGGNLTVTTPANYAGTFLVTVTASDGTLMSSQPVLVTVTDQSPQLGGVADKATPHNQQLSPIALSVSPGAVIQSFVSATGPAADLQRQLGLYLNGSYYQNFDGLNEKWLYSATQRQWYVILPDGEVRPANTISNPGTDVATLDSSYWQDPNLIYAPPLPAVTATVSGGNLIVKTPTPFNYAGSFQVGLTASDGLTYDAQRFTVSVTDKAPLLQAIFAQRMSASQQKLIVVPQQLPDPDGDMVNLQAVVSPATPAATLQQQLGLYFNGSYYQNYSGLNEKWLYSATQRAWYVILPDGEVRPASTINNPGTDVATLDPSYWQNPSLIFAPSLPATVSVSGGNVTVSPVAGYTGTFYVTVVASDGVLETQQRFLFTVTM
jgi:hypothetical protein